MSDKAVAQEIGQRIRGLRLRKNISQKDLADATMLSLNSIKSLESGRGKLSSLIAVLRQLGALEQLDSLLPESYFSPMQLVKMQGKVRERASGERSKSRKETPEW